jgi:hypothetical protein
MLAIDCCHHSLASAQLSQQTLHTVQDKKGGGASKETEGKAALQAKMKELESKLTERVTKDRERKMALRYRKVSRESRSASTQW